MSVLKVTEVQSEEVAKKDEVVAGQVRMAKEGERQHGAVVLIVDAINSSAEGTVERPYIAVVLDSTEPSLIHSVVQNFYTNSAERIKELFPVLLDAELTYKEAK